MDNQIECPVCGVMIDIDDNSGLKIECPNCHEMVTNAYAREKLENKRKTTRKQPDSSKSKSKKSQNASDYMIIGDNDYQNSSTGNDGFSIDVVSESKYDEDGVKKELVNALVEKDNVPSDIFEKLNIEMVRKYYLPYQLFEGTYQVPWNAVYEWNEYVDYVENGVKKTMRQKQYGESNGIADGKFSYLYLVCSGDNIPPKLFKKAQKKTSVSKKVVPYSSDIEEGENVVVMPNSNFETNWTKKVSKKVLAKGKEDAEKQARSNEAGAFMKALGTGASLQNYNYQVNYDLKKLQTILIPFWYIDYNYQDTHYGFIMDGGGNFIELESPENEEELAIIEENEKKKTSWVWGCMIFLVWAAGGFLGSMFDSWLVFFVFAAVGFVMAYWSGSKDEKVDELNMEVRNENKKQRQEKAQGLLSNWSAGNGVQKTSNENSDKRETETSGNDDYLDSILAN
jgi:Zn-finger nucleic acid-binding protein